MRREGEAPESIGRMTRGDVDSGLSLRDVRGMTERKKAGIAPGLSFVCITRDCEAYFASARFGGVAGHDFTSVS